nr:uncharacterized protein LOC101737766 isoform X4 [Bombyx mori]
MTSPSRMPYYEELVPISPKFKRNDELVLSTPNFIDALNLNSNQNLMLPASEFECIEIVFPAIINFDEQLIMPPYPVELPYGLGYLPAAVPLVENYFTPTLDPTSTNLLVPIANDFDYMALATPLESDLKYSAKPIIL